MKIGISTACYYPAEVEKALESVVAGGAECTEVFINAFSEMSPEYLHTLRAILSRGSTSVTSLHPFTSAWETMMFFGDYPRRFEDGLEIYKRYFEMTAELGGRYLVLHGGFANHAVSTESYIESYRKLHDTALSMGVMIAQENVGRCMSRNPELLRSLREAIPDIAFVLDIKQTFRGDGGLDEVIDAMGNNIVHLHLCDARPEQDCLPVGSGLVDFEGFMRRMSQMGYKGDAVLELYSYSYTGESQLWNSVEKLHGYRKNFF